MLDGEILVANGLASEFYVRIHRPQPVHLEFLVGKHAIALCFYRCLFFLFLGRTIFRLRPTSRSHEATQVFQIQDFGYDIRA